MITSDDARDTLEMDDRYVIIPAFDFSGKKLNCTSEAFLLKDECMVSNYLTQ